MKIVILAGGSGTRLWPISRESYPKQFMNVAQGKSLLQLTAERVLGITGNPDDILVSTSKEYKFHTEAHLAPFGVKHTILEPARRSTAPAVALIVKNLTDVLGCDENETVLLCSADHLIAPTEQFVADVRAAEAGAKEGNIVLFGIRPTSPETGYGYIHTDGRDANGLLQIESFKEKPDRTTAESYLLDGNYLWNGGMFLFSIKTMCQALEQYAPEIGTALAKPYNDFVQNFGNLPEISIDYAVMEHAKNLRVQPLNCTWTDVGSWDSLYDEQTKDTAGNAIQGNAIVTRTQNSLIWTEDQGRLVTVSGLEDVCVVDTYDALYVGKRGDSQNIKAIVNVLKERKAKELTEHRTMYRPWGSYTVLEEAAGYKVKRITVSPGSKLSLQMHHHRSEHWVVIRGTAEVTRGSDMEHIENITIVENESVYIPKTHIHRLANPGKTVLEIIEIQVGGYLEEDDIVRFEDTYGRA